MPSIQPKALKPKKYAGGGSWATIWQPGYLLWQLRAGLRCTSASIPFTLRGVVNSKPYSEFLGTCMYADESENWAFGKVTVKGLRLDC